MIQQHYMIYSVFNITCQDSPLGLGSLGPLCFHHPHFTDYNFSFSRNERQWRVSYSEETDCKANQDSLKAAAFIKLLIKEPPHPSILWMAEFLSTFLSHKNVLPIKITLVKKKKKKKKLYKQTSGASDILTTCLWCTYAICLQTLINPNYTYQTPSGKQGMCSGLSWAATLQAVLQSWHSTLLCTGGKKRVSSYHTTEMQI